MAAHFEVFGRRDGEYGWRLIAANGEIVAVGEGYTREADAERGVRDTARAVMQLLYVPEDAYALALADLDIRGE